MKATSVGTFFAVALLIGCNIFKNDEQHSFYLLDGTIYNNPKVKDFKQRENLKFEPYIGLYFKYEIDENNTIKIILFTKKTEDINSFHIYNDDGKNFDDVYNKLKDDNVTMLKVRTPLPKGKDFWDPILKNYEKELGIKLEKEKTEQGHIWKYRGEKLLTIEYHPKKRRYF